MADIRSSTWSTTAGDNNASPPDGWPEGQSPSSVNNCAREMMAAIKRAWNDDHPVNESAGSNSAYTLVTSASSTAYATGDMYAFRANHASVGTSTLNVNGIGARVIKKFGNQDTIADDIKANQVVQVAYEPSADVWQLLTAAEAPNLSNLTDVDLSGGAATGDTLAYNGTDWTATTPSTTLDSLSDVDVSSAATGDALVYDGTDWVPQTSSAFFAYISGSYSIPGGNVDDDIPFDTTDFNVGSDFNTTTSEYTTPVAGIYTFTLAFLPGQSTAVDKYLVAKIFVDGSVKTSATIISENSNVTTLRETCLITATFSLTQGQVVKGVSRTSAANSFSINTETDKTFFCGHLVQQTA